MRINKLIVIVITALIFSGTAFSQKEIKIERKFVDKLNLTDTQKEELAKLRYNHQKQMLSFGSELKSLALDMKEEWRADNPDKKKIEALQDKIATVRTKMAKERTNHWFEVYGKLDDKQKKEFKKGNGPFLGMGQERFEVNIRKFRNERMNDRFMRRGMRGNNSFGPFCPFAPEPPEVEREIEIKK